MTIKLEHGVAFVAAIVAIGAVWYAVKHKTITKTPSSIVVAEPPNPVTNEAGDITPQAGISNVSKSMNDDEWNTPYYLRANYPDERGGAEVVPSVIAQSTAFSFGPQEISPSV